MAPIGHQNSQGPAFGDFIPPYRQEGRSSIKCVEGPDKQWIPRAVRTGHLPSPPTKKDTRVHVTISCRALRRSINKNASRAALLNVCTRFGGPHTAEPTLNSAK